jgi:hypothetical protein
MNNLVDKKFIYKKTGKRYLIIKTIEYKDENTHGKWITAVIYKPLYECEIPEFSRSLTMFLDLFEEDPIQD